jgi:hypothetical protein
MLKCTCQTCINGSGHDNTVDPEVLENREKHIQAVRNFNVQEDYGEVVIIRTNSTLSTTYATPTGTSATPTGTSAIFIGMFVIFIGMFVTSTGMFATSTETS